MCPLEVEVGQCGGRLVVIAQLVGPESVEQSQCWQLVCYYSVCDSSYLRLEKKVEEEESTLQRTILMPLVGMSEMMVHYLQLV